MGAGGGEGAWHHGIFCLPGLHAFVVSLSFNASATGALLEPCSGWLFVCVPLQRGFRHQVAARHCRACSCHRPAGWRCPLKAHQRERLPLAARPSTMQLRAISSLAAPMQRRPGGAGEGQRRRCRHTAAATASGSAPGGGSGESLNFSSSVQLNIAAADFAKGTCAIVGKHSSASTACEHPTLACIPPPLATHVYCRRGGGCATRRAGGTAAGCCQRSRAVRCAGAVQGCHQEKAGGGEGRELRGLGKSNHSSSACCCRC